MPWRLDATICRVGDDHGRDRAVICLLCEPEDTDAIWLAAALRRRGEDVEVVLPEEVMVGSAITCRIDSSGVSSTLRLHDGRVLANTTSDLIVNRLIDVPPVAGEASCTDAAFLVEEWRATLAAWLRTMTCAVMNPPRAATLTGPILSTPAWRAAASAHGLTCRPWDSEHDGPATDPIELTCVAGRCIDPTGHAPEALAAPLAELARFAGTPLLGATFDGAEGEWAFLDATPWPRLSTAGTPLVEGIAACARKVEMRG